MEKTLKILSISTSDTEGGAARAMYRIHTSIGIQGIDSSALVKNKVSLDKRVIPISQFEGEPNFFKNVTEYIENKIKNKIQHYQWSKYPKRENVFMSDLRAVSINNALQKLPYDILHLHWFNLRYLDITELTKINKPIVWTLHDSWAFTGICHIFYQCNKYTKSCGNCPLLHSNKENDLSRKIWQKKKNIYEDLKLHVVTPSEWLADAARNSSLLNKFLISVIPNPIDTELYSPGNSFIDKEKLNLNKNKKYLLFGAHNAIKDKNKGFNLLQKAIEEIRGIDTKHELVLLVFGNDNFTENIEIKIPVTFLNYLHSEADIISAYRAADVMIVPSLSETFGQTASEAMACGTPVVAFNCTGIKEVVSHKETGYLAEVYNPVDLAKGIIWCIDNNIDNKLSINARKRVEERYSMEKIGIEYCTLYKNIYQKKIDL